MSKPPSKENKGPGREGVNAVAEMLNWMDPETRKRLMENLARQDSNLAQTLESKVFGFENLIQFDDRSLQHLLREIPYQKLALALRKVPEELKARILKNLSETASQLVLEEMEAQGKQKLSDVHSMQREIAQVAQQLIKEGKIQLQSKAAK